MYSLQKHIEGSLCSALFVQLQLIHAAYTESVHTAVHIVEHSASIPAQNTLPRAARKWYRRAVSDAYGPSLVRMLFMSSASLATA